MMAFHAPALRAMEKVRLGVCCSSVKLVTRSLVRLLPGYFLFYTVLYKSVMPHVSCLQVCSCVPVLHCQTGAGAAVP